MDPGKKNVIRRDFYRITGEMLINTNMDKAGDKVYIFKNEDGYLSFNQRTKQYAHIFPEMLRDPQIFKMESYLDCRADPWWRLEAYGLTAGAWDESTNKTEICVPAAPGREARVVGHMDTAELGITWTAPIEEIAAATLDAANSYYKDGQAYLLEGDELCICHRWVDKETGQDGINFEGIHRNLFCDPKKMGTFLPGIASGGLMISMWPPERDAQWERLSNYPEERTVEETAAEAEDGMETEEEPEL